MKYKNDTEKVPVVQPQRGDITCIAGLKNKRFRPVGALGIRASHNPTAVPRANDSVPLGLKEPSRQ